jgi:hypothetical protein
MWIISDPWPSSVLTLLAEIPSHFWEAFYANEDCAYAPD